MNRFLILLLVLVLSACKAQNIAEPSTDYDLEFTSDLSEFRDLSTFKSSLEGVEIVALGENTHGLGDVFKAKVELVKFLHEELGFDLLLFESGYGDAAFAWENIHVQSSNEYLHSFTSNAYYHCESILELVDYAKSQEKQPLNIQGIDCQPQQDYLAKMLKDFIEPIDSAFSKKVPLELKNFNKLYQSEFDKDSVLFYQVRERFFSFLEKYQKLITKNEPELRKHGQSGKEIEIIARQFEILESTYSEIQFGEMMGWPQSANIRDRAMFQIVKRFKADHPSKKIIIWAQNSHIENPTKAGAYVDWMGHHLKSTFGDKYYSMGAIVYSGKDQRRNEIVDFEHNDADYLAYHLNQSSKKSFVMDLRNYTKNDFLSESLLGMENNGNTGNFIAKDRFDGLLFLRYSGVPHLLE